MAGDGERIAYRYGGGWLTHRVASTAYFCSRLKQNLQFYSGVLAIVDEAPSELSLVGGGTSREFFLLVGLLECLPSRVHRGSTL